MTSSSSSSTGFLHANAEQLTKLIQSPSTSLPSKIQKLVTNPHHFCCPISLELFTDAVLCEDEETYERSFISTWVKSNNSSPTTRKVIGGKFIKNRKIMEQLDEYKTETSTQCLTKAMKLLYLKSASNITTAEQTIAEVLIRRSISLQDTAKEFQFAPFKMLHDLLVLKNDWAQVIPLWKYLVTSFSTKLMSADNMHWIAPQMQRLLSCCPKTLKLDQEIVNFVTTLSNTKGMECYALSSALQQRTVQKAPAAPAAPAPASSSAANNAALDIAKLQKYVSHLEEALLLQRFNTQLYSDDEEEEEYQDNQDDSTSDEQQSQGEYELAPLDNDAIQDLEEIIQQEGGRVHMGAAPHLLRQRGIDPSGLGEFVREHWQYFCKEIDGNGGTYIVCGQGRQPGRRNRRNRN